MLLLKVGVLLIDGCHEGSHVSEDKRSHDGAEHDHQGAVHCLGSRARGTLVSDNQQDGIVEYHGVLLQLANLEEVSGLGIQVLRGNPFLLGVINQHVPDAAEPVH